VEEYGQNFKSLWDTVKAFGGSPGVHKGLVEAVLKQLGKVATASKPSKAEKKKAIAESSEVVKAALLISKTNKQ
jgi:hypothetical protein